MIKSYFSIFFVTLTLGSSLTYVSWQANLPDNTFLGSLVIRCTTFTGFYNGMPGTKFTVLDIITDYNGTYNTWAGNIWTTASMNQSIINTKTPVSGTKTISIGSSNKTRLLADYPNAETDANARNIYITYTIISQ